MSCGGGMVLGVVFCLSPEKTLELCGISINHQDVKKVLFLSFLVQVRNNRWSEIKKNGGAAPYCV